MRHDDHAAARPCNVRAARVFNLRFASVFTSHSSETPAVIFSLQQINHLLDWLLNPAMCQLSNLEQDEVQHCKKVTSRCPRVLYGILSNSAGADSSYVFTMKWLFTAHDSLTGEISGQKGIVFTLQRHISRFLSHKKPSLWSIVCVQIYTYRYVLLTSTRKQPIKTKFQIEVWAFIQAKSRFDSEIIPGTPLVVVTVTHPPKMPAR